MALCCLIKNYLMANTYHQVYIMFVFAVKYRRAMLDKEWRSTVFDVMGNLINENGCKTLIVNGVEDHVHCLIGLGKTISQSELMKIVKAKSSKYINDHKLTDERFEWQRGYGAFSYSKSHLDNVYKYVENQEEHHKKQKVLEEYVQLLNSFDIEYDEKYIFHDPI